MHKRRRKEGLCDREIRRCLKRQGDTPLPEALHSAQGITAPSHTRSILKEAGMAGEAW
ncbi:hypothetical protein [Atopobium sp. oral taxon 416]|uniref:hypothetical protein n=1 Tax=Atopobium sp. oral taxon 416 TaxID=712157 RepID=UPI001BAE427E|nr:hypothetical protein J4859_15350 [Atopobium sp. oral taxon 416]